MTTRNIPNTDNVRFDRYEFLRTGHGAELLGTD
jgi:hypothetical protein